jgi:hypothetical protein
MKYLLIAGLLLLATLYLFIDWVPASALTRNEMASLKRRILRYAHVHDCLPIDLSDVPVLAGRENSGKDACGRPIAYEVGPADIVRLTSLGKDGLPGGAGDNADIVRSFQAKDAEGNWADEFVGWLEDCEEQDPCQGVIGVAGR